jgi:hypothetical protein
VLSSSNVAKENIIAKSEKSRVIRSA